MSVRRVLRPVRRRGICRYCRCTENNACRITLRAARRNPALKASITCSWLNDEQTVCTNPQCVRKHKIHERTKKMRRKIRVRHGRQLQARRIA